LCHSEILMPKDTKSLGNNKAPACESRGFVRKKQKVCILTHLLNHYRNIFFTLDVHNNDNDLIVANVFIIVSVKHIYFSKRLPRRCSSYSLLNHCLIIIQTIQRIGDFCFSN
ncbi:hypothetical protein, partial [Phocaeicola vulgatus]|uniref:hypothetical protein n=1 Tax=Phocaeicola vulgatus TaxID=821 RepID=UPI001E293CC8